MTRSVFHLVVAMVVAAGYQPGPAPSHIFHSGKILTVDPQFRTLQAFAIRDGRIVAVGTNADITKLAGAGTAADRSWRQDGDARTDRFPRPCAERVDVRVRAAGTGYGDDRGRPLLLPRAGEDERAGDVDHAVAGLHYAASRAALSDARRARWRSAQASSGLPHRARTRR